ncbi:unnamed protein product [Rotaria sordida]|uniref:Cadherin domain-containing protein n=1 Tax=Rotaria sordida TaxID=392033 RepID=A0A819LME5_9BILA|nr:unnamed protein product [Rotaria sordida]CAF3964256.1 unnamed protein product [Rotaria sordida]
MFLIIYIFLLVGFSESRELEIIINEETPIGTNIFDLNSLSSSSSSSSSLITYQLLESSSLLFFNSTTNIISISKRIDRDILCPNDDLCSTCYLIMKFYDMFYYDILLLKFKINDINDNQPIFSSNTYSISLTENNMPGIKIRLSKADDIDCLINSIQYYELTYIYNNHIIISKINLFQQINQTINFNQPFYLYYDIINFDLYLIINITLDRELQHEYIFTLTVNDYKYTTSTKLTLNVLDVNDHNPKFSQTIYTVNISHITPIGTILIKLTAYDEDLDDNARIYYSLLSIDGNKIELNEKNDLFQLNSYTGELSLISKLNHLDSKNIFKLIIGASDGTHNAIPALTTVYINILNDIYNDNKSLIQITFGSNLVSKNFTEVYISENLPNATFIAYIKSDENLKIEYDEGFFIQKLTDNSFTLLTDRIYDRELRSSYNIILRNKYIQRSFKIIVTDINDCKPIWNISPLNIDIDSYDNYLNEPILIILNASDYDENSKIGYRKKSSSWPQWILLISNELIINCTLQLNDTNNDCWFYLTNGEIWLDIEAYDIDNENFSSIINIRLYRSSILSNNLISKQIKQFDILQLLKHENIIIIIAILMGLLFVIATILICMYCRRELNKKPSSLITNITDDNSTKQKIIQTSSSEQTSSAGSLYGSEKSENITVETSDMFLFSPKRTALIPYSSDNLTNKLFHSIQTDLSLLTETNQQIISTRGTYV